jgi:nitronate monooxygenase
MKRDDRIQTLFGIELPIVQAPMAGYVDSKLVIAVAEAGGLGSLPCALLDAAAVRAEVETIRRATSRPINLNFFCHSNAQLDASRAAAWRARLEPYYVELGVDPNAQLAGASRSPFDEELCDCVVDLAPQVVSFHFGLPEARLVERVKKTRAKIMSSATTVDEARWLEDHGCDAIIAQGSEAGGHRGMFLQGDVATQVGTMALVPQVVDAVKVPVIAAGGIADARGIVASLALGASAVQIGTAFLFCPEVKVSPLYRRALDSAKDNSTTLTNVFTGRPARSIMNRVVREAGPISPLAPPFPLAAGAVAPLRVASEANGSTDFTPLWAGQALRLGRSMPAGELTRRLAADALRMLSAT